MTKDAFLLGLDIGSSSIKASLISIDSGQAIFTSQSPAEEMPMIALRSGWAEQDPDLWWSHVVAAVRACLEKSKSQSISVLAIGIAYQMHGLVVVGLDHKPLRNAIIWCDSRAVQDGNAAFEAIGKDYCLSHFLNSPGNFTASKLKWVKSNEPRIYDKIHKAMLPGDYIALKLTGEISTTSTGLSEGIFWDFENKSISEKLLRYYGFDKAILPTVVPVFSVHGQLTKSASAELGLTAGIKVSYRAGDQPNNAFSLNVLNPGETAATAGTSGVIYGVTDRNSFDQQSRVNAFLHVNDSSEAPRNGILLCVNGTGIQNSWLRKNMNGNGTPMDYAEINEIASATPAGADGISVLPFGNGAERILVNTEIGGSIHGINFNRHHKGHIFRAAQEGIVFALKYGHDILNGMGLHTRVIRAGHANLFLSPLFREAFANTIGCPVELYDTDGATGAALGAGVGAGIYLSSNDAFHGLHKIGSEDPTPVKMDAYEAAYNRWADILNVQLADIENHPKHQNSIML